MQNLSRREFLRVTTLATAATVASACTQTVAPPASAPVSAPAAPTAAPAVQPGTEPGAVTPTTAAPAASVHSEAPMLAALVEKGELPPVDERLPENPSVYPALERNGIYGGTIRRAFSGVSDSNGPSKMRDMSLVHYNPDLSIRPDLCESWDVSQDAKEYTIHLRKGTRWSDGEPFDASAISWWYDNVVKNKDITPVSPSNFSTGTPAVLMDFAVIDDYTVTMTFASPNPFFMHRMARTQPFMPGHYLSQFHLDFVEDQAKLEGEIKARGFGTWVDLFVDREKWFLNPERPNITPWLATNALSEELFVMERNPYFCAIDSDGQQLPYIDRFTHRLFSSPDVLNMWVVNGEIDWQQRHMELANYTLFSESQEQGDYHLVMFPTNNGDTFCPNHAPKNPRLAEFFQNLDVRIALNHAVDRETINEIAYDGLAVPRQASFTRQSPYYIEKVAQAYTEYDPDTANELLDEAGYAERDGEGFRKWKDGSGETLSFVIEGQSQLGSTTGDAAEMVTSYLKDVGVKCSYKPVERSLYTEHQEANEFEASLWGGGMMVDHFLRTDSFYAGTQKDRPWAGAWCRWYWDHDDPNGEPPPDGHFLWDIWPLYEQCLIEPSEARRMELLAEWMDIYMANIPAVGLVGEFPGICVTKNGLVNAPLAGVLLDATGDEAIVGTSMLWWDDPTKRV